MFSYIQDVQQIKRHSFLSFIYHSIYTCFYIIYMLFINVVVDFDILGIIKWPEFWYRSGREGL